MKQFELVGKKAAGFLYEKGADEAGLSRIAKVVAGDIYAVTRKKAEVIGVTATEVTALAGQIAGMPGDAVLAGVVGAGGVVDMLAQAGLIRVDAIRGKRESFAYQLLFLDEAGVLHAMSDLGKKEQDQPEALKWVWVIAGSERIGALYGLLEISRRIGVSDWCYWADVAPKKHRALALDPYEIEYTSKEPSVKLRGFFMNDEWPSLGNWVSNTFGDFNVDFYEQVFVLLLRLKGNFLWPAMWSASFPIDGALGRTTETDPLANAKLADELGITMSTSHHEPLMRASEEWDKVKTTENNVGYGKDWNYFSNPEGLHRYWYDGVTRNAPFKNLYTLGMRGERDSKIMGDDATMLDNVNLLKNTILDQKGILADHGLADAPKVLALYKEVEDYYYGDATTPGLDVWEELDDVMLLLSDDNFANCRTLPTKEKMNRKAGWGLYYHFDYHGGPISYEWVNSTALEKVWDQMTLAYEYGIRDLWVVNVGDLRPQELPLSYFLSLAYDFEQWGTSAPNTVDAFVEQWVRAQFGVAGAKANAWGSAECCRKIEQVLHGYTHMNANRRPEVVYENTFSVTKDYEAGAELAKVYELDELCDELWELAPAEAKAALYGLVVFPAKASANIRKMMIYAGYYELYAKSGNEFANVCHELVQKGIEADKELVRRYHEEMADGKWKGMMMSNHVGFHRWNDEGWSYPVTTPIEARECLCAYCEENEAYAEVSAQIGSAKKTDRNDRRTLMTKPLSFHDFSKETHVTVLGYGDGELELSGVPSYLNVQVYPKFDGETLGADVLAEACALECCVSLSPKAKISKVDVSARFEIRLGEQEISVCVPIEGLCDAAKDLAGDKVMVGDELILEASRVDTFEEGCEAGGERLHFTVLSRYGKTDSTLRMEPVSCSVADKKDAPKAHFTFWVRKAGTYEIALEFGPSNPLEKGKGQLFGVLCDEKPMKSTNRKQSDCGIYDSLAEGFVAGDYNDWRWNQGVLDNVRTAKFTADLSEGAHTITYFGVDAGVLLQRIVIRK